jgi:RNA ligase (TIGR02306 family)
MSTHIIPVIRVEEVREHPNADKLDLIPVGGWLCAVRKGDFKVGDLAVYIEPDFMVPVTRPEFAFLKSPGKFDQTYARIRGKRLRGIMSFGLLIKAPESITLDPSGFAIDVRPPVVGDNLLDIYGIHRWEPPMVGRNNGQGFTIPQTYYPVIRNGTSKFDLENINNYPHLIEEGEHVYMTEKVHGANARYVWYQPSPGHEDNADPDRPNAGQMIGSRSRWLRPPTDAEREQGHNDDIWHLAFNQNADIGRFCADHPNLILYGEVYGNVQDLKYGMPNRVSFVGFAMYDQNSTIGWLSRSHMLTLLQPYNILLAPLVYSGPFSRSIMEELAETDSDLAPPGHMREGLVITPYSERIDPRHGRVALKYISNRYWTRS